MYIHRGKILLMLLCELNCKYILGNLRFRRKLYDKKRKRKIIFCESFKWGGFGFQRRLNHRSAWCAEYYALLKRSIYPNATVEPYLI